MKARQDLNNACKLSLPARTDLKEIPTCTCNEWGQNGLEKHMGGYKMVFEGIGTGKITNRTFSRDYPNLFHAKSGRHFVFHTVDKMHGIPTILAMLHEKMDIAKRLNLCMENFRKRLN